MDTDGDGDINEPCTLPILAETVAKLYHVHPEVVAMMATMNAQRLYSRSFGVPLTPDRVPAGACSGCKCVAAASTKLADEQGRGKGCVESTDTRGKGSDVQPNSEWGGLRLRARVFFSLYSHLQVSDSLLQQL